MSTAAAQIDSAFGIVTPENIAFEYQMAGPLRRLPAYLIDVLIRALVFIVACVVLGFAGVITMGEAGAASAQAILLLMWFALEWFYGGLFETFWNGQTPGKRALGLRVLTTAGEPINGGQAILRNFLRLADAAPFIPFSAYATVFGFDLFEPTGDAILLYFISPTPTFLLGFITPAMNRRWQRLGDLAAGTMVVIEEPNWLYGLARMQDQRVADLAQALPVRIDIARSTAKALAMYVERRRFFSPARRQEIAMHLGTPLIERYHLPPVSDHDLLLCAVYYKVFVSESPELADRPVQPYGATQPYRAAPTASPRRDEFEIRTGPLIERRRW
jgi:uncharacterized RDD family membrane protein YckC